MKKTVTFILTALLYVYMCTFTASAMPNPDLESIDLVISNIPDECAYIDILVNISESDSYYTDYNSANMKACDFDTTELKEYESGGFVSFSCHCKDAQTDMHIKEKMTMTNHEITKQLRADRKRVQIAVLDKNGHILQTSMPVLLDEEDAFLYGNIKYDVDGNTVDPDIYESPDYNGLYMAFIVIISAVFVMIVYLAAHSFVSSARKTDTNQLREKCEETPKGFFKATAILTVLYIITALIQGVAMSNLYMTKNTTESVLLCCAQLLPLIIAVVTAVRFKDFFKFIIPDVAFGVVSFQYGDVIMIFLVFIFIVVQVFSMFLSVLICSHSQKKKRRSD